MNIKNQKTEPKRIEWNLKNMHKLEPLMNRKLYTAITTILKNTVVSRATAGPINTFNSKTVTVLNP